MFRIFLIFSGDILTPKIFRNIYFFPKTFWPVYLIRFIRGKNWQYFWESGNSLWWLVSSPWSSKFGHVRSNSCGRYRGITFGRFCPRRKFRLFGSKFDRIFAKAYLTRTLLWTLKAKQFTDFLLFSYKLYIISKNFSDNLGPIFVWRGHSKSPELSEHNASFL